MSESEDLEDSVFIKLCYVSAVISLTTFAVGAICRVFCLDVLQYTYPIGQGFYWSSFLFGIIHGCVLYGRKRFKNRQEQKSVK